MKKIFLTMAVALLSAAMFTSCNNNNPEAEDSSTTNEVKEAFAYFSQFDAGKKATQVDSIITANGFEYDQASKSYKKTKGSLVYYILCNEKKSDVYRYVQYSIQAKNNKTFVCNRSKFLDMIQAVGQTHTCPASKAEFEFNYCTYDNDPTKIFNNWSDITNNRTLLEGAENIECYWSPRGGDQEILNITFDCKNNEHAIEFYHRF